MIQLGDTVVTDAAAQASCDASAGGKVILCGEHSVVHGGDALVVGLNQGVTARATRGSCSLTVGGKLLSSDDPSTVALRAVTEHLQSPGASVSLEVTMPLGVGLGGSAAMAVAVARAIFGLTGANLPERDAFEAAQVWERVFHGNPSGVDAAAATYGGCLLYNRDAFRREVLEAGRQPERVHLGAPLQLGIAVAGPPSLTKTMVEQVASYQQQSPQRFAYALDAIQGLVKEARRCLESGNHQTLGSLMSRNHELLAEWGLSTPQIERARRIAIEHGALGSKLTGAGGGGCVIALCTGSTLDSVLAAWRIAGYATSTALLPQSSD